MGRESVLELIGRSKDPIRYALELLGGWSSVKGPEKKVKVVKRLIKALEKDRLQRERKQLKSQLNSAEDEDHEELQHRIREIKEIEKKYYK